MASILDKFKTIAPVRTVRVRQKCWDVDGAYDYFRSRVAEQAEEDKWTWIRTDKRTGKVCLEVNLHSFPLYWGLKPTNKVRTNKFADGKEVTRPVYTPQPKLFVKDVDEGKALLKELANTKDEGFMKILERAAKELKAWDEEGGFYDQIEEAAKNHYSKNTGWVSEFGAWDVKDVDGKKGKIYSKEKTAKMNTAKQWAKRNLGLATEPEREVIIFSIEGEIK